MKEGIFFDCITQIRGQITENSLADGMITVQGRIAESSSEFIITKCPAAGTIGFDIANLTVPAAILTDIGDVRLTVIPFH